MSAERGYGEGAVVLSASARGPMAVAEALQERVGVVIGCKTFRLAFPRLRCPEVLPVGREYGGKGLAVFLRSFSVESSRLRVGGSRAHHRAQIEEVAQMFLLVLAGDSFGAQAD